jgi:hypothetical protein
MKPFSILSGLVFLLFAYFQLNDPDPERWVPLYLVPALGCFWAFHRSLSWWLFALVALVYLIGAVLLWPPEFEGIFFGEMEMRSLNIELARESLGLATVSIVMGVFAWYKRSI